MTMIETNAFALPQPTAIPSNSAPTKTQGLSSDFETFLKMLTAQARNQDPLKPIDSTEYASQLAQFSMVEQQVQTNNTLSGLAQSGSSSITAFAGWVGMEARADMPIQFSSSPVSVAYKPSSLADQAMLVVRNQEGAEVQTLPLPLEAGTVEWAGVGENGAPVSNGRYSFSVLSLKDGAPIAEDPAEVYGQVKEVQFDKNDVVLILDGGLQIPASSVTALRSAD